MSDSNDSYKTDDGLSSTVTGEIIVASVIIIFVLFTVTLILYLRAKGYSGTIGAVGPLSRPSESAPDQPSQLIKQALDPSILKSLPVAVFRPQDFAEEGGLECPVCLLELRDGEMARLLPKCRHGFHVECIDMWFMSNSTCPLCRNPVGADNSGIKSSAETPAQPLGVVSESGNPAESQNSSAKSDEGSSSSGGSSFSEKRRDGMLVIEIPRRAVEGFSSSSNTPLPSSRTPAEGIKSPALERLRSLRRILSRGSLNNNCVGSSCSPRDSDIEQGTATG